MNTQSNNQEHLNWDIIIKAKSGWFDIPFVEIYRYRDLIFMLVKRDFVTFYKQTILGPLWYIIQPVVNSVIFTIILGCSSLTLRVASSIFESALDFFATADNALTSFGKHDPPNPAPALRNSGEIRLSSPIP